MAELGAPTEEIAPSHGIVPTSSMTLDVPTPSARWQGDLLRWGLVILAAVPTEIMNTPAAHAPRSARPPILQPSD
jgi:hypothetical protein